MTDLAALNDLPAAAFVDALAGIFEHAPWVGEAVAARRPFADPPALLAAMVAAVEAATPARQLDLLRNHPDLAGKAALAGDLTSASKAEQDSAGLDQLSAPALETLRRLNRDYRARFGFPFIICVRRHTRDSILRQFERRLTHARDVERRAALLEVGHIAALRLHAMLGDLDVAGRLSTHVLDTHAGRPAAGMALQLLELSPLAGDRVLTEMRTNPDGRTDAPLIAGRPVPIGTYELRFRVADYFRDRGVPLAEPPFLDVVPLRFAVAEPEQNYHVPLVVTPWSYATYRGS